MKTRATCPISIQSQRRDYGSLNCVSKATNTKCPVLLHTRADTTCLGIQTSAARRSMSWKRALLPLGTATLSTCKSKSSEIALHIVRQGKEAASSRVIGIEAKPFLWVPNRTSSMNNSLKNMTDPPTGGSENSLRWAYPKIQEADIRVTSQEQTG